jgi:hypothetical protein
MRSFDELGERLVGRWDSHGAHPLLAGDNITGSATFEWLDGRKFLIWRSHYDHPQIPDAIAVIGSIDDQLLMHYFDYRGVHRVYKVAVEGNAWRYWRDDPGFQQSFVARFSDDFDTMTGQGRMNREDAGWEDDLTLTYRRNPSR